jgi:hypothetical protein
MPGTGLRKLTFSTFYCASFSKKRVKKVFCLLLLAPFITLAAETEVWSCQGTAASGLYWEDGQWLSGEFGVRTYRVELQDSHAIISENNDPVLLELDCEARTWSWSCSNDAASLEFRDLNNEETTAVFFRFFGAVFPDADSELKDSIYLETLACTKF